jgi:hypothetical protein
LRWVGRVLRWRIFSVDGISTANVRQNGALQDAYPSQEGIAAVKLTSFNNSAEFSQIGDVTFTTKNGTNNFHGDVFEYLQNQTLDATPYGFSTKAPKKFNTFSFSFGGPVTIPHLYRGHDKALFFVDYEGNRRTIATAQQFEVPTQAERNGDLSGFNPSLAPIPAASISPTARALLTRIPLPNVNGQSGFNYENFQATRLGRTALIFGSIKRSLRSSRPTRALAEKISHRTLRTRVFAERRRVNS